MLTDGCMDGRVDGCILLCLCVLKILTKYPCVSRIRHTRVLCMQCLTHKSVGLCVYGINPTVHTEVSITLKHTGMHSTERTDGWTTDKK